MNKKLNDNDINETPIQYSSFENFIQGEGSFFQIPDEKGRQHEYFVFLSLYERDKNDKISATRFKNLDQEVLRDILGVDKKELSTDKKVSIYNALCDIEDGSKTAEEVLFDILNKI